MKRTFEDEIEGRINSMKLIESIIFLRRFEYLRSENSIIKTEKKSCHVLYRFRRDRTVQVHRCAYSENRWTGGCKQTRRMPKLLSPMHPLSQLPLLSVLVLTLRRSLPNFPSLFSLLFLRAVLWTPPTHCISPTQLRHSQPLCVNSCTYRERIPTGKGILLATFTLHNAGDLCFLLRPVPFYRAYSFVVTEPPPLGCSSKPN